MLEAMLADPRWFPDRIDAANRLIRMVPTTHPILADSAFLDGRTPLSPGGAAARTIGLEGFARGVRQAAEPMRWIFHASFCGSTLLARTLSAEGQALCLREPQVLVDLANWRARLPRDDVPLYRRVVAAVRAKLAQRWIAGEAILTKPSNWTTAIIDDLWRPGRGDTAVILDIALEPFLVAVVRGGRERIAYTLRFGEALMATWPRLRDAAASRLTPGATALTAAAELAAAAHWMQRGLLHARAATAGIDPAGLSLLFPDFCGNLAEAARFTADRLHVAIPTDRLAQSALAQSLRHAKQDMPMDARRQAQADETIRALHGEAIAAGIGMGARLCADLPSIVDGLARDMTERRNAGMCETEAG